MNTRTTKRLAILTITVALTLALATLALPGCDSGQADADAGAAIALTEDDSGASLTVYVGDTIAVMLSGNPTTGYSWESDMSEADSALLILDGGEPTYVADDSDPDIAGGGGVYTFTFSASGPGQVELKLKYWRPFEPDTEPLETFSLDLTIE